jgi:hypothetical protein
MTHRLQSLENGNRFCGITHVVHLSNRLPRRWATAVMAVSCLFYRQHYGRLIA